MTQLSSNIMQTSICPYSIYSLQFLLLFPLIKLGQFLELPTIISYIIAVTAPTFILDQVVGYLNKANYVTLVKHSPNSDHPHTSATTLGVIFRSILLGIVLNIGLSFVTGQYQQHFVPLGFYLIILSLFHFSEFFVTSLTNPSTLNLGSFLIDQSLAYVLAITGSFVEYLLEAYMFTGFKKCNLISMLGLLIAVIGDVIRKSAMFTAGKNFSHVISSTRSPDHKLVTHGIYSLFRHPSYAGWFYWAIGSQIMLLNPICTILFAVISYKFFKDRIIYEEETLVRFFNGEYEAYKKRVGLWMPI